MDEKGRDRRRDMRAWLDNEMKAQLVAFYQQNPGVVETVPGLAQRIGVSVERVAPAVKEHVELGLLQQVDAKPDPIIIFNRARQAELQRILADLAKAATWEDLS